MADWSETVNRLGDEDSARRVPLRVAVLGLAPLLIQRGLAESLAGWFELLQPARSYALSVTAEDAGGVEIGANIIHGGPVHTFGVSDPAAEAALVPASVECSIGGLEPKLRVAPSVSPEAEVSFMVSRGDRIRLLG